MVDYDVDFLVALWQLFQEWTKVTVVNNCDVSEMGNCKKSGRKTLTSYRRNRRFAQLRIKQECTRITDTTEENIDNSTPLNSCNPSNATISSNKVENKSGKQDIVGRRIINIKHFFESITSFQRDIATCNLQDLELFQEHRKGLFSTFDIRCRSCRSIASISTESEENVIEDVNICATSAVICSGGGYSQLKEIVATLDIPCMSRGYYDKCETKLFDSYKQCALELMMEAGKEESELARASGEVDQNGIPLLTVIADGAWCKRSYKTKYDSKSGVGCIVGAKTGKLLFLGVRNKYCSICSFENSKNKEIGNHICFKNYEGTSTSMESDIIVEGFKTSLVFPNYSQADKFGEAVLFKR